MSVTVRITKSFKTTIKPLLKKYPSLSSDLLHLERKLIENPKQGTLIGTTLIKSDLRFPVKGKAKVTAQE